MKTIQLLIMAIATTTSQIAGQKPVCDDRACYAAQPSQEESRIWEDMNYIQTLMREVASPLKATKRFTVAYKVAQAGGVIENHLDRRSWYVLLAIESKFVQSAQSHAGAIGIGQIVPIDVEYLSRITGITFSKTDLIRNVEKNLAVSAALYSYLIQSSGSRVLALVAYNAGLNSRDVNNMRYVASINTESANYLAKHSYLIDLMVSPRTSRSMVAQAD